MKKLYLFALICLLIITLFANNKGLYSYQSGSSQNEDQSLRGKVLRIPDFFKKEENNLFEDTWTTAQIEDYRVLAKLSKDQVKEEKIRTLITKLNKLPREKKQERREIRGRIKELIDEGASVNMKYTSRWSSGSLVHAFIDMEDMEMIEYILKKGARVDIVNSQDIPPLSYLFNRGIDDIAYYKLLLKYGSDVNARSGYAEGLTVLMDAARVSSFELIKLFLDYGADINAGDHGQTALWYADFNVDNWEKSEEICAYLIARGAEYSEEREESYYIKAEYWAHMLGFLTYDFSVSKKSVNKYLDMSKQDAVIRSYFYTGFLVNDTDFYLYHPVKMFDGLVETGWKDGEEGAGSSGGIILDRPVTIDEIRVIPGRFDKKQYNDNNRIKSISIRIGNEIINHTFKNECIIQKILLDKNYSFYEIDFIIKDVYESKKSGNTTISEMQFYYQGNRILLHLSKSKKYQRKFTRGERITEIQNETLRKNSSSSNTIKIEPGNKLSQKLFHHFLKYCSIPDGSITWEDKNKNGVAEIEELFTLNIDHLKRLWKYSLNIMNDGGFTSDDYHMEIMMSIKDGLLDNVEFFLNSDINIKFDYEGLNFITYAAMANNIKLLQFFYKKGVNIDKPYKSTGWTPLFYAINSNHYDAVKWLIDRGVNINHINKHGDSPLMISINRNNPEITQYLLDKGAQIDIKNNKGENLLLYSAKKGNYKLVKYFFTKGININDVDSGGNNAAMAAVDEKIALFLIDNGSAYTIKNNMGKTLFEIAAKNGWEDVVGILIKKDGVLINGVRKDKPPLILAAMNNHTNIVRTLLSNGADVLVKDKYGNTPMIFAVFNLNVEMTVILKNSGACIDCRNELGLGPKEILHNEIERYEDFLYFSEFYEDEESAGLEISLEYESYDYNPLHYYNKHVDMDYYDDSQMIYYNLFDFESVKALYKLFTEKVPDNEDIKESKKEIIPPK